MTAISDLIDPADRRRLLERLAELESVGHLLAEPGQQRPPDPPVPLARAATQPAERTTTS